MRGRLLPYLPLVALACVLALATPGAAPAAKPAAGGTAAPYTVDTPTARPHATRARTTATCWTARGCSASTRRTTASRSGSTRSRAPTAGSRPPSRTRGTRATTPRRAARRRRLVPQGLPRARRAQGARVGGALRVGQLPLERVAQRASLGDHAGAYIPFEFGLPNISARGVNRLVIRVDNRRPADDFPPRRARRDPGADRRLVELLGAAARGLPRGVDRVDSRTCGSSRGCPCPRCAAASRRAPACATSRTRPSTCAATGRFGKRASTSARSRSLPGERTFTDQLVVRQAEAVVAGHGRTSTA